MLAFLRGASIVAAIAWWSPTHEPGEPPGRGGEADRSRPVGDPSGTPPDGRRIGAAVETLADLRRAARDAEALRRAWEGSPLAAGAGEEPPTPARPGPAGGDRRADGPAPRPR